MNKQFTCIICPRGCKLTVKDNEQVEGNFCPRGKTYALSEINDPRRTITSTVLVVNRNNILLPVKCDPEIKKDLIFPLMDEINKIKAYAPIKRGDILLANVLGSGVNIIATKDID